MPSLLITGTGGQGRGTGEKPHEPALLEEITAIETPDRLPVSKKNERCGLAIHRVDEGGT